MLLKDEQEVNKTMRKLLLYLVVILFVRDMSGQTNPIDELFGKYSGKEGFSSVFISSKMLGLFTQMETADSEVENVMGKLKSVRILSVTDSTLNRKINFHAELSRKMDFSGYEELMVVKEGQDITYFLTKQTGESVSELLMITGGKGGNTLISIRGDFSLKDISGLSKNMGIEELKILEDLEKKMP